MTVQTDRPDAFIFRDVDGCAFALIDCDDDTTTEDQAWREIYLGNAEMIAAINRGVTARRQSWAEYSTQGGHDCLASKCDHAKAVTS